MRGKCKFFLGKKGWGFLTGDDGNEYFCHFSGITGDGYREIHADDEVEFEVQEGLKGKEARNVKVIKAAPASERTFDTEEK